MVRSGQTSNSFKTSCMSYIREFKMDLINSNLEKVATLIFSRSRAATCNSVENSGIWPKVELIQALMHVLVSCKHEDNSIRNSREKVATPFYYKSMAFIQTLKGSLLCGRWSDLAKLRTPASFHSCPRYLQI